VFLRYYRWLIPWQLGVGIAVAGNGSIVAPPDDVPLISKHQYVIYRDSSLERDHVFINGGRAKPFGDEYRAWVRLQPGTNTIAVTEPFEGRAALLAARVVVYAPDPAYDAPMGDGDGDGVVNDMDRFPYDPRVSLDPLGEGYGEPWIGLEGEARIRERLAELGVAPKDMFFEFGVVRTLTLRQPTDATLAALTGLRIQRLTIIQGDALSDLGPLAALPLESLTLSAPAVKDLSPLTALPLTHLSLANSLAIRDLAPLSGIHLRHLDISHTAVSNLFTIAGLPLRELVLNDTPVTDLHPLADMPLRRLSLDRTRVTDVRPLRVLPLETLSLQESIVAKGWDDLLGIRTLRKINDVELTAFQARLPVWRREAAIRGRLSELAQHYGWREQDLEHIWNAPELELRLNGKPIHDLIPLRGLPLAILRIAHTAVTDLKPLQGMPLRVLDLRGTAVRDLRPLRGMPLEHLTLPGGELPKGWSRLRSQRTLQSVDGIPIADFEILEKAGLLALLPADPAAHPGQTSILKRMHAQSNGVWTLAFATAAISNLPPLRGLPVDTLDLSGSGVRDLTPLKKSRVTRLDVSRTGIRSLTGLEGVPLQALNLSGAPVGDLAGLGGQPLTRLNLRGTAVRDLTPLRGLPLETLDLFGTPVTDLSPLAGMPLRELDLSETAVESLEPLRGMPLTSLKLACTRVRDLAPLEGLALEIMDFSETPVDALDVLRGMPLRDLRFRRTGVTNIAPLADMPITFISSDLTNTAPISLAAHLPQELIARGYITPHMQFEIQKTLEAAGVPCVFRAHILYIQGDTSDLSPLAGLPIVALSLRGTPVRDLSPLRGLPLKHLSISRTRVTDLSPLRGMALEYLSAEGLMLEDLTPLAGMPLRMLKLQASLSGVEVLREMPSIKEINGMSPDIFWSRYDADKKQSP
jgi:hypothetical protein